MRPLKESRTDRPLRPRAALAGWALGSRRHSRRVTSPGLGAAGRRRRAPPTAGRGRVPGVRRSSSSPRARRRGHWPVLCMNPGTKRFEGPRPGPGLVGKEARGQTARQHSPPCQTHLSLKGGGRRAPFLPGTFVDANPRARAFKRLVRDRTEAGGPRRVWGRAVPLRICTSLPTPPHGTLQCSGNGKPHGIWE